MKTQLSSFLNFFTTFEAEVIFHEESENEINLSDFQNEWNSVSIEYATNHKLTPSSEREFFDQYFCSNGAVVTKINNNYKNSLEWNEIVLKKKYKA